eukprot:1597090-Rhodomonas_salina.2
MELIEGGRIDESHWMLGAGGREGMQATGSWELEGGRVCKSQDGVTGAQVTGAQVTGWSDSHTSHWISV